MPKCSKCWGRGWYPETIPGTSDDYEEKYCTCVKGRKLRERESN